MKKRVLAVILAGTMAAGSLLGCTKAGQGGGGVAKVKDDGTITIAVLPKMKGENYWDATKNGAEEAVEELTAAGKNVKLIYDGPPQDQATNQKQVDLLEGWIAQGVDAIAVGCVDASAISPTLKKAQSQGIKVVTYDTDAEPDARDLYVCSASETGMAEALVENAAAELQAKGYGPDNPANVAMMGQTKTDVNIEAWKDNILKLLETDEYNWMKLQDVESDIYYPGADEVEVQAQAATLISRMGKGADKIQCAFGNTSMTGPALASQYEAASDKPSKDEIVLTGVATPNAVKTYVLDEDNPFKVAVLWNCMDLGYLAVQSAYQLAVGDVTANSAEITTERLGTSAIEEGIVQLGEPLVITKDNVEDFDY